MNYSVTDLSDSFGEALRYPAPIFADFGGQIAFSGPVKTIAAFEDNSLVREAVEQPGHGRVLVVDGGGSTNCALFGGNLAALAEKNGWAGVVIFGYVRDKDELNAAHIGIKALGLHPKKSEKRGLGTYDISLTIAGTRIHPNDWLYADADGIVIAGEELLIKRQ